MPVGVPVAAEQPGLGNVFVFAADAVSFSTRKNLIDSNKTSVMSVPEVAADSTQPNFFKTENKMSGFGGKSKTVLS